jgi:hypothetical protein
MEGCKEKGLGMAWLMEEKRSRTLLFYVVR